MPMSRAALRCGPQPPAAEGRKRAPQAASEISLNHCSALSAAFPLAIASHRLLRASACVIREPWRLSARTVTAGVRRPLQQTVSNVYCGGILYFHAAAASPLEWAGRAGAVPVHCVQASARSCFCGARAGDFCRSHQKNRLFSVRDLHIRFLFVPLCHVNTDSSVWR